MSAYTPLLKSKLTLSKAVTLRSGFFIPRNGSLCVSGNAMAVFVHSAQNALCF